MMMMKSSGLSFAFLSFFRRRPFRRRLRFLSQNIFFFAFNLRTPHKNARLFARRTTTITEKKAAQMMASPGEELDYDDDDGEYESENGSEENVEEDEEAQEEEQATTSEGATTTPPPGMKPWIGLQSMPQPTRDTIAEHMQRLQTETGDNELTVVLVGRQGVGKSSTVNALINEKVANDQPFVQETVRPLLASRAAGGFNVHVIDTPGLLDGESVSSNGLMALRAALDDRKVHCFVFMQRLDSWRCDSGDELMIRALCQHCGADVFDRVVLGFSHGELKPPNGETTQKLVERRYAQTVSMIKTVLKKARKKNYNDFSPPMAVVENSSRCPTNADGEKCVTLENDQKVPWLPALVGAMVDASTQSVKNQKGDGKSYYLFDYKKIKKSGANPNTRHKLWMLPAVLVQWFVLRPIIVKVIRNDIRKDRAIDRYAL